MLIFYIKQTTIDIVKMFWYNKFERKQRKGDYMKKLVITPQRTDLFVDMKEYYRLGTTNCAFGNVVAMLEGEFPAENYEEVGYLTNTIINQLVGKGKSKTIWGISESGTIMHTIYSFLSGKDKINLTLKDMEEMRILHGLNINYLPINRINIDDGIEFKNIKSIKEVIYSLLYYYAYNNLKLVKCEHCGRWFATTTLKNKYCPRKSTFSGYTQHNCEQAVRNISQELQREKKRIYNAMTTYTTNYGNEEINNFLDKCSAFRDKIKNRASVENLSEYWEFLKNYKDGVNNG